LGCVRSLVQIQSSRPFFPDKFVYQRQSVFRRTSKAVPKSVFSDLHGLSYCYRVNATTVFAPLIVSSLKVWHIILFYKFRNAALDCPTAKGHVGQCVGLGPAGTVAESNIIHANVDKHAQIGKRFDPENC
jgi:hypothetical protein